jgi:Flp pilus assembly pilin Flp
MSLLKRLWTEEYGQGLVEYTFVVMLIALILWLVVKDTSVGMHLAVIWTKVTECVTSPFSCGG